jgi:hypothetical protein
MRDDFRSTRKLADDCYMLNIIPDTYGCYTCIQESVFTLDNAKYWYLNYYYGFINKALDMDTIHITTLDTDSIYFAVAGNPNKESNQGFEYVIKDKKFYDENVNLFLPNDELQKSDNRLIKINDEMKLLGCAIEKHYDSMICLGPKCYTGIINKDETKRVKGVSLKKNKNITFNSYLNVLDNKSIEVGIHTGFQMKDNKMTQIFMNKNALTCAHNKMYVFENHSCAPLIKDVKYLEMLE